MPSKEVAVQQRALKYISKILMEPSRGWRIACLSHETGVTDANYATSWFSMLLKRQDHGAGPAVPQYLLVEIRNSLRDLEKLK